VELACDLAVLAGRGKPVYDVLYQLGADLVLEPERGGYVPTGTRRGGGTTRLPGDVPLTVAGEASGSPAGEVFSAAEEGSSR
jgi:hypothetical protein